MLTYICVNMHTIYTCIYKPYTRRACRDTSIATHTTHFTLLQNTYTPYIRIYPNHRYVHVDSKCTIHTRLARGSLEDVCGSRERRCCPAPAGVGLSGFRVSGNNTGFGRQHKCAEAWRRFADRASADAAPRLQGEVVSDIYQIHYGAKTYICILHIYVYV